MWTLKNPDIEKIRAIVAVGKEKIYFVTSWARCSLAAHDLKSGAQLYEIPLQMQSLMTTSGNIFSRTRSIVWRIGNREILVFLFSIDSRNFHVLVGFLDGATGELIQCFDTKTGLRPSLIVAPGGREIALVSHNSYSISQAIKVQRFVADSDGKFYEKSTDLISMIRRPGPGPLFQAIHPFHDFAAGHLSRGIPVIGLLEKGEKVDLDQQVFGNPMIERFLTTSKGHRETTLPPRYSHHKARRLFIPKEEERAISTSFETGDRLFCQKDSDKLGVKFVYYIFDFGLRVRRRMNSKMDVDGKKHTETEDTES